VEFPYRAKKERVGLLALAETPLAAGFRGVRKNSVYICLYQIKYRLIVYQGPFRLFFCQSLFKFFNICVDFFNIYLIPPVRITPEQQERSLVLFLGKGLCRRVHRLPPGITFIIGILRRNAKPVAYRFKPVKEVSCDRIT